MNVCEEKTAIDMEWKWNRTEQTGQFFIHTFRYNTEIAGTKQTTRLE